MADRQFSWQKENPRGNAAKYAEIMADIDARNPTKPGQYTGLPVPANQREVGTADLRQYTMGLTGTKKIRNFINKYKAKK